MYVVNKGSWCSNVFFNGFKGFVKGISDNVYFVYDVVLIVNVCIVVIVYIYCMNLLIENNLLVL